VACSLGIRLLGSPTVTRDGEGVPARGRKLWALLAVLLLSDRSPSRARLAALLFSEADDPLAALRWNLAQLRRVLGPAVSIGGDPVVVELPDDRAIDLEVLTSGTWTQAIELPGLGDELLGSLDFSATAPFDTWLGVERARVVALTVGHLTEAALTYLATGDASTARDVAARLVELQPFDENHHQLLVRAMAGSGDIRAAGRHVERVTELFRRELNIAPSSALAASASLVRATNLNQPATGRAGVVALLEAGDAAVDAGATESGIDCLRRAARDSDTVGDTALRILTRIRLGAALIHAVRGSDTEGAATLHQAIRLAEDAGLVPATASAHRDLAWIAVQQGRQDSALTWLQRATELAGNDRAELARILGVRGLTLDDQGQHHAAIDAYDESASLAVACRDRRQLAWSWSMRARTLQQLDRHDDARAYVDESLHLTRAERWNAFLPYPETQQAELDVADGSFDRAIEGLGHAFTLACQIGDPCWEALAARCMATVDDLTGAPDQAIARLGDARRRCNRHPDTYRWVSGQVLNTMAELGVQHRDGRVHAWIADLEALAISAGLRELVVRALLHRSRLGDEDARATARLLVAEIDNPSLADEIAGAA
jgi:DNA-binding SARP family transcriptional activator